MRIVISTACYNTEERVKGFLESLTECYGISDCTIVVLDTAGNNTRFDWPYTKINFKKCKGMRREPTSGMYEKIKAVKEFCDDNTILMSMDDDYSFNPYALEFIKTIFEENPQVNYLSPGWYPGVCKETSVTWIHPNKKGRIEKLSGFELAVSDSCLGGALVARWSAFYPMISNYFKDCKITGEDPGGGRSKTHLPRYTFDQAFFHYMRDKTGDPQQVYTLLHFSLLQHCNLVSTVLKSRGSIYTHMHLQGFDPRMNPFQLRDIAAQEP